MVAGDNDDLGQRPLQQHAFQTAETFLYAVGVGRQAEIEGHNRRLMGAKQGNGLFDPGRAKDAILLRQPPLELFLDTLVIFDDQKFVHRIS